MAFAFEHKFPRCSASVKKEHDIAMKPKQGRWVSFNKHKTVALSNII